MSKMNDTSLQIFDFHSDLITENELSLPQKLEFLRSSCDANGMVLALWTSAHPLSIEQVYQALQPFVQLKLPNVYFSIEDLNLLSTDISSIAALPFLFWGIVWNNSNRYASSCFESVDSGLTSHGKKLASALLQRNRVLDVAHASKKTFLDILNIAPPKSVVCSHTCFDSVHSHARNLDFEQCRYLVDNGGIVGLTLVEKFLGGGSVEHVLRHIDWFADKFGVDNLCLGTDFFGATPLKDLDNYAKVANLRQELYKKGWTSQDVDKCLYANLQNFIKQLELRQ